MPMRRANTIAQIRILRAIGSNPRRRRVPRTPQPDAVRLEYWKGIRRLIVEPMRALVAREVIPLLPALLARAKRERGDSIVRLDATGKDASEAVKRAARKFAEAVQPREIENLAEAFAKRTNDLSRTQTRAQVRAAFGVDVIKAEPNLAPKVEAFTAENVSYITSISTQYFDQVEQTVIRGVRSGMLASDLADEIAERGDVSDERAALIARDQIGKFYGDLNSTRQKDLGVTRYIWRTVHDNRVRSEHDERDGFTFAWVPDAAADGVEYLEPDEQPGQPINCRCFGEPDFSDILDSL